MSVLFISHDLALVGEIADSVVVMRDGVMRETGPGATRSSTTPQDAYTQRAARLPPAARRRAEAPAGDRRLHAGQARAADHRDRVARGAPARRPAPLRSEGLRKEYRLKTGLFARKTIAAVKDAISRSTQGKTLGLVGESGSGKTTVGMLLMRLHRRHGRQVLFEGSDLLTLPDARDDGLPPPHPDHLPEPVRQPQPALHRRPDPDRADEDPRHRRERARALRARGCSWLGAWACRRQRSTSTRTSSPAASASASRSRAA